MKNSVRIFSFLSLIFVLSLAISAQIPTPSPTATPRVKPDDEIATKTVEVRLPVRVNQKGGKKDIVKGLSKGDFIISIMQSVIYFVG